MFLSFALLLVGCNGEAASRSAVKEVLSVGMTKLAKISIPDGPITVMSGLSSQMETDDPHAKRYNQQAYRFLKYNSERGLVDLQEQSQSDLQAMGRMGAITVIATPTPMARSVADKDQSEPGFVTITQTKWDVLTIVRDTAYIAPDLPSSEEYRLVLGTVRATLAAWMQARDANTAPVKELRFKALLRLDRFSGTYKFLRADTGDLDSDAWHTNTVK